MELSILGLKETIKSNEKAYIAYDALSGIERGRLNGFHHPVWRDRNGIIIRDDIIPNLIVNTGAALILTSGLGTAYIGLIVANRVVADCVTNGNTTISSATATFVSGDVGRYVTIVGAGAAGANYTGTIASVTNTTVAIISSNTTTSTTAQTLVLGPLIANTDTSASHAGWAEISSSKITNGTRPSWNYSVSVRSANGGTSPAAFTLANAIPTQYIDGFFVSSNATLGSTANTLISAGEYGGTNPGTAIVGAGATLTDTYTITLS